jgi:adenylate cyclase
MCAPLPDDPQPGWGLYVTGKVHGAGGSSPQQNLLTGDLKFTELVAEIFGSLRQVRSLQRRQALLARFLSRPVLAVLAEKGLEAALTPREAVVTVLFCDLRGSSRRAEEAEHDLAAHWNRVSEALGIMTGSIIDQDGVVGDFQGDAAMGFWGWPLDGGDSIERAARAALTIWRRFGRAAQDGHHPLAGFHCGIGLAHGPAIAGRLGTPDQFKVGVFGPVVNLASRLESMTRHFRVPILVDDACAGALCGPATSHWARCRRIARVRPYGMRTTVLVHELLPPAAVEPGVMSDQDRRDYEAGLDEFLAGHWDEAQRLFRRLPRDGPAEVLNAFMDGRQAPPPGWEGVIPLEAK